MPVCVALTVYKRTIRGATVRHDGDLVSIACHRLPLAAQPSATRAWKGPQGDTLVDALECGRRVAACRGKRLAAVVVLSRPEACRSPGLAGTRGASRQAPWNASVGLPGKLLLPGPCLLDLNTLFLNGSKGATEYLGGHPTSPCRGALQLPMHKFGVLGYPYSSTPTGNGASNWREDVLKL